MNELSNDEMLEYIILMQQQILAATVGVEKGGYIHNDVLKFLTNKRDLTNNTDSKKNK